MNVTNRGLNRFARYLLRRDWVDKDGSVVTVPATWKVALVMAAGPQPGFDTNTLGELVQPTTGGYVAGGIDLERSATGFPAVTEDDTNDQAFAGLKDLSWTAIGGDIGPVSAVVLTDDAGVVADRQVLAWFPCSSGPVTIASGTTRTFQSGRVTLVPSGFTNRGLARILRFILTGVWHDKDGAAASPPANFYALLASTATPVTPDTNVVGDISQPAGGGYVAGGYAVPPNATGFPTVSEDDANDWARTTMQNIVVAAVGADIGPVSQLAVSDDAAAVANRQLLWAHPITGAPHTIAAGTTTTFPSAPTQWQQS